MSAIKNEKPVTVYYFVTIICLLFVVVATQLGMGLCMYKQLTSDFDQELATKLNFQSAEIKGQVKQALIELGVFEHNRMKREEDFKNAGEIETLCKNIPKLCPPPVQCSCGETKSTADQFAESPMVQEMIRRTEIVKYRKPNYPGYPKKKHDCKLRAIGIPLHLGFVNQKHGSWMKDSNPSNDIEGKKFWMTNETDPFTLFEFSNKNKFIRNLPTKTYRLTVPFQGNAHVVYNGSFYYHARNKPTMIRFFLNNETSREMIVPELVLNESNALYTTNYNYLDFSVDDNGLWVIFPFSNSNNTAVIKVDVDGMQIQSIWNVNLNHHEVGEMFVACGVLYAIDSVKDIRTNMRYVLDLYTLTFSDVNLMFRNPFGKTTMVGYNHRSNELFSWDNGNQLAFPLLYE